MAREVTFIVGNGLDISLDMKTKYRDFYDHIKKTKNVTKNGIYESIQRDPESWAEFELKLGEHTRDIEKHPEKDWQKESSLFHEDLEEFINDLADYLREQEKSIKGSISLTRHNFYEELSSGQRSKFASHLLREPLNFHFITLNYTNTLIKVLPPIGRRNMSTSISVKTILHLHGDLIENLTLGLSDESQLSTALKGIDKTFLIKPDAIEYANDGRSEELDRCLKRSSIVVIFGASLGDSDKYLWIRLINWLKNNQNANIIIHRHNNEFEAKSKLVLRRKSIFETAVQDKLLNHINLDEKIKLDIRKRIYVIHNTEKLFRYTKKSD